MHLLIIVTFGVITAASLLKFAAIKKENNRLKKEAEETKKLNKAFLHEISALTKDNIILNGLLSQKLKHE